MAKKPDKGVLPTREQVLAFIQSSDVPAGKREIAKAFGLHGAEKIALKALLRDMGDEGLIDAGAGRAFHKLGGVPKVTVLRVVDVDDSGKAWAVPERWEAEGEPPRLRVMERKGPRAAALGVGDRVLARNEEGPRGWIAHPMKKLLKGSELVLGVVHQEGQGHWLKPVEKKERRELPISDLSEARVGDLVLAEKVGRPPRISARVDRILGDPFAPRSFSLIAIHKHEIPHVFGEEVLKESARVAKQPLGDREDLAHLPIVAIDPADARDHDDAVWATEDDDPKNAGGWKAIVAIADVSFYVRPGSALDREARRRGNSVYFPDRVVPMLPEELSADICSLKQGEDRAALACHLQVAKDGTLKSWQFTRARVRIRANIAYEDAQAAIDADEARVEVASSPCSMPEIESEVMDALRPLWACWRAMYRARAKRAPLELDLPERRVVLDEKGRILSVAPRERLDAHKLIEDYMIAANVAAAKALEAKTAPVMYRVHEPPSREKLVALRDYLKTFGIEFALGQVVRPETFNRILARARTAPPLQGRGWGGEGSGQDKPRPPTPSPEGEGEFLPQVMEQVLRTQTQAYYAPRNQGHFGLALGSYGHFTSPIRRYADLLVHRSLVRAYRLGEGGLTDDEAASMEVTGELISNLERRAMIAERETMDRYVAAYLSEKVGELLPCRITGVQSFGFFATVEELGGDGLVPAATLGNEYFRYDEASQTLTGEDSGEVYAMGRRLTLRLAEASPVSGGLRFELPDAPQSGGRMRPPREERGGRRPQGKRGRPSNIRHQGRKK
ncbi:ribonuclease R family protein [Allosphingosinicella sp.]|uniref:ribonuclease R family protein n=1 Tax=Allosphingosinicella sp. TaxID=2823234 RepID=UPI0037847F47